MVYGESLYFASLRTGLSGCVFVFHSGFYYPGNESLPGWRSFPGLAKEKMLFSQKGLF
jgi:hypothetical protein